MSTAHVLPPHRHLSEPRPLTTDEALANIQSYLEESATQAHLHPDCIFSERIGPTFSSAAGTGGLVLQQLRRFEAGLRGVWMGVVEPEFESANGIGVEGGEVNDKVDTVGSAQKGLVGRDLPAGDDARLDAEIEKAQGVTEAWENVRTGVKRKAGLAAEDGMAEQNAEGGDPGDDAANYQEQLRNLGPGSLEDDIGERSNVVGNVKKAPRIQATTGNSSIAKKSHEVTKVDGARSSKEDKRAAKKAKNKEYKAQKEAQRTAAKQQDTQDTQDGNGDDVEMREADDADGLIGPPTKDTSQDSKAKRKAEKRAQKLAKVQQNLTVEVT